MQNLINWYSLITTRKRNILRFLVVVLSAIPYIGWYLIAPWMLPLILFLEYHLDPKKVEQRNTENNEL
jgi:hypothetical protein